MLATIKNGLSQWTFPFLTWNGCHLPIAFGFNHHRLFCHFPLVTFAFLVVGLLLYSSLRRSKDDVYDLPGISLLHAWLFFYRRFDFIQAKFKETGRKAYRFKVVQHKVVALSGEKARQAFFSEPTLSLAQGYRILTGGPPDLTNIDVESVIGKELQAEVDGTFVKRVLSLLRKDRIANTLPTLLEDLDRFMKDWGTEGKINPFKEVYTLVFQMTIRMGSCEELSNDRKAVEEFAQNYWTIEQNSTPISLLFPWFPSPMQKAKEKATTAIYNLLLSFVIMRRNSPVPSLDPIDLLISQGDSDENIVGTIMAIIFAGVINTGIIASWCLLHIGFHTEWKHKIFREYQALVENHTQSMTSSDPPHRRLAMVPLNAWENDLPTVDLILRETLRIIGTGSAIRRNVHKDINVDGITVRGGEFMTYQVADAHLNPDIYTNPTEFDPERFLSGREEDKKQNFSFLGWGAGRHPCAGMRLAKLEIKLVLALMMLGCEWDLVDASGKFPRNIPEPNKNDILQVRPREPCYLQFKRRL